LYDRYGFNQSKVGNYLLSVSLGFGIGLSLFINGSFIQGANGLVGEIGHTIVPNNKKKCYCGKEGCLRTLLTYRGIIDELLSRLNTGFSTNANLDLIKNQEPEQAVEHIIDMAIEKDPVCMRIIHDTGTHLGTSLANVVMLLNPDVLLINSNLTRAGEIFTAPLRFNIENNSLPPMIKDLKIEFSLLNPYSVARGGAILSQNEFIHELTAQ
jgi:predicted NBD/HSP70 family sugar kinase